MNSLQRCIWRCLVTSCFITNFVASSAQPILETGGKPMPDEWLGKDTHHKIIKLTRKEGSNYSFYFHNNPFVGDKMVFYTSPQKEEEKAGKIEISNTHTKNREIYMTCHEWRSAEDNIIWYDLQQPKKQTIFVER